MVFQAAGKEVAPTDLVAGAVFRRQALVVIAAHALVTTREEAQGRRHLGKPIGFSATHLHPPQQSMALEYGGQTLELDIAVQHIGIGQQPLGRAGQIKLQAVAVVGVDLVITLQVGITQAWHQQRAGPRVIAQVVLLVLPFQRQHALPAAVELAVPFRADSQQTAAAVGIGQVFGLIAAGHPQFIGQRRIERHVIPQANILPRR